jgi:hypothetical protein
MSIAKDAQEPGGGIRVPQLQAADNNRPPPSQPRNIGPLRPVIPESGELTHLSGEERLRKIADLSIYDIEQDRTTTIAELFKCT